MSAALTKPLSESYTAVAAECLGGHERERAREREKERERVRETNPLCLQQNAGGGHLAAAAQLPTQPAQPMSVISGLLADSAAESQIGN